MPSYDYRCEKCKKTFTVVLSIAKFEKNKTLSAMPTANESSSGLGLYIVKKYVDQMNGAVTVESQEGKGSTFFVTLPR